MSLCSIHSRGKENIEWVSVSYVFTLFFAATEFRSISRHEKTTLPTFFFCPRLMFYSRNSREDDSHRKRVVLYQKERQRVPSAPSSVEIHIFINIPLEGMCSHESVGQSVMHRKTVKFSCICSLLLSLFHLQVISVNHFNPLVSSKNLELVVIYEVKGSMRVTLVMSIVMMLES